MSELEATNYNRNYLFWGSEHPQRRQRPGAGSGLRRPERHAGRRPQTGSTPADRRRRRSYGVYDQISRPDAKATSNYGSFEAEYAGQRRADVFGPDRHLEGPRRDADAGRVRDGTPAGTRRELRSCNGTRQRAGLQLRHAPTPRRRSRRHAGRLRLDLRRPARRRGGRGGLGQDRRRLRHRRRRLDRPEVRRALHRAQARVARRVDGQGPISAHGAVRSGELSDDVPELSVRLQHLRRIFPTDIWFWSPAQLAAYNGAGQREPRPASRADCDEPVPGRGGEHRGLRAGELRGLELERQHRPALRADRGERRHLRLSRRDAIRTRSPARLRPVQAGSPSTTPTTTGCRARTEVGPDRRPGGPLRGREDHDARRTIRRWAASSNLYAARHARRDRQRHGRQPGPRADPLDQLRRRPRVVLRARTRCCGDGCSTWISTTTSASAARPRRTSPTARSSRTAQTCRTT